MTPARLLIAFLAFGLLPACATVTPPAHVADPVEVYVADYGRHASLILPEDNGLVEFAFGEWRWFALEDNWLIRAPGILLLPARGTLGRRALGPASPAAAERLGWATGGARVLCVTVDRARASALALGLENRFERARTTMIDNPDYAMQFVRDPAAYWLPHNCNNTVAGWLRDLGCGVSSPVVFSRFRIVPATKQPPRPAQSSVAVSFR